MITRANICNKASKQRYSALSDEELRLMLTQRAGFQPKSFSQLMKLTAFGPTKTSVLHWLWKPVVWHVQNHNQHFNRITREPALNHFNWFAARSDTQGKQ